MAWALDPHHTHIEFAARHMMITTVRGQFNKFSGELNIDEQNPQHSTLNIVVDVNSIDTREDARDGHLRSPDFFDVANYPTLEFRSKYVEATSAAQPKFKVVGDLTIKDISHEVVLDVTNEGKIKGPDGKSHWGFTATTKINRKDWDLNWNVALEAGGWLVGEEVRINIDSEAVKQ